MEYEFRIEKQQIPSRSFRELEVPSGTPYPIYFWGLTVIGREGERRGVVAIMRCIADKNGQPIHDQISMDLALKFQPAEMKSVLDLAVAGTEQFSRILLSVCAERLAYPAKMGECREVSLASYELCKDPAHQLATEVSPANREMAEAVRLMLLGTTASLRESVGLQPFS